MITRGYFIGFILDELTSIAHQVDTRCSLGLTDINRFLEDFFKDVINAIEGIHLVNLNSTRSNTPGLDLGDQAARIAYQVTSQKTSAKVQETLEKITDEQLAEYDDIRVLVIGTKQRSYTLDEDQCRRCNFSKENIRDLIDLCKDCMDMKLDDLQELFELVKSQVARVKVELETPAPDGTFPTSMRDYIEALPRPRIGSCEEFVRVRTEIEAFDKSAAEVRESVEAFSERLAKLPRITREFFAILLERRDPDSAETLKISQDKLRRICSWHDIDGEIRLLEQAGLVTLREQDSRHQGYDVIMFVPGVSGHGKVPYEHFQLDFIDFMERKPLSFQKVIVNLDFGEF